MCQSSIFEADKYHSSGRGVLSFSVLVAALVAMSLSMAPSVRGQLVTQDTRSAEIHQVTLDVYIRSDSERCDRLREFLDELARKRRGLNIVVHNTSTDDGAKQEALELCNRYRIPNPGVPVVHVMDRLHVGYSDTASGRERIASLLSVEVFTRNGCNRCRDAKAFLRDLEKRWPALKFDIREITTDRTALNRLNQLVSHYRKTAASVPAFHLCGQLKIGFVGPESSGRELETLIRKAARAPIADSGRPSSEQESRGKERQSRTFHPTRPVFQFPAERDESTSSESDQLQDLPDLPDNVYDDLAPLPELSDASDESSMGVVQGDPDEVDQTMDVPFFGGLNARKLGMPAFTFLVGLVDGFNPCAMWVLMFLLSVLVNIRERRKILVIAGTFVIVSGLAYFAFMAAWLNVFMLVGLDRPAQLILAVVALVIGAINIKDFFSFKTGVSLSIPESAKPGLYARVRKIVAAKHISAALLGAITLAVLVNVIELLCTAGLPAMYTEILTLQQYSATVNYLYIGLYIIAYMLDDSIMVAVVVVTLSKKKLQEGQGRWLKLLSGIVILALGVVMIFKPSWLV